MIVFHRYEQHIESGKTIKILDASEKKRKSIIISCYFPVNTLHQKCEISKTQKFTTFFSFFERFHTRYHTHYEGADIFVLKLENINDNSQFFLRVFYSHRGELQKLVIEVAEIFE